MVNGRFALIIASDRYNDKKLTQLKAPIVDAEKFAILLKDPSIGGEYEVNILHNTQSHIIRNQIEKFFTKTNKDDLRILYFAGHGHKSDKNGKLYLATEDSDLELLETTTISAEFLNKQIQNSKSSKIVLILDCCYSGAFARDMIPRSEQKSLNLPDEFRESGCVVLTSSTAMQQSFEGNEIKIQDQKLVDRLAKESTSFYTNLLMEGIATGEADINNDGAIGCKELSEYIKTKLKEKDHPQEPEIYMLKGDITIAYSNKSVKKESTFISSSISDKNEKERINQIQNLLLNTQVTEFNSLRKNDNQPLYLAGIDLNGKDLTAIDLHETILNDSNFRGTKLNGASLSGSRFINADLTGAYMRSVNLYGAILKNAKLIDVDLRGADLKGMIDFSGADLSGANLKGADLEGMVNFDGAILHNVDFTGANTDNVLINFKGADLKNVTGLDTKSKLPNKYLEALSQFSERTSQLFKEQKVSTEKTMQAENSIKDLVKEVESLDGLENIDNKKKIRLQSKIEEMIENIVKVLPPTLETSKSFNILNPFNDIYENSEQNISSLVDKAIKNNAQNLVQDVDDANQWNEKGNELFDAKKYEEAIRAYDKSLEIDPRDVTVYNNKGNCLYALRQFDDALTWYDKALEVDPKYFDALYNKGLALENLGRYEDALTWYDKALEVDPKYVDALYNKGLALENLGRYEDALTWYGKALEVDPKYVDALNGKGVALDNLGRYEDALTWYDKALEVDPKYAYALRNKGLALKNLGRYEDALTWYDKALEVDPRYFDALNGKGVALDNLGRYEDALTWYGKALEVDPRHAYALRNKGLALKNLGRYEDALTWYDKALEVDPRDFDALNDKGVALDNLGRYEDALTWYGKALEVDPRHAYALYNKGLALEKLGRYEDALTWYDKALEVDPRDVDALNGKNRLKKYTHKKKWGIFG